ncbi:Ig-like domain-containing protein [Nocardioides alpinus]|uniref:Ig-like domain-containing protein n=1 Tax=Nocardioides alpinus TaxID=748909 RepID=A0A1I0XBH1_9ACTN|nr:DUF4082 domain-containing protein [Nocardioides alpinus]PKH44211.1 hypothetical protein CXG46_01235 [Nocardioides alpinus]SFA97628.1 Ig-like domain-containing protein [Nocardioides alpinus]
MPGARRFVVLFTLVLVAAGLSVLIGTTPAAAAPCDPPVTNAVACENTLPGNPESEWGVTGAGSLSIQGFATDMSVDQGQPIGFKVDTAATSYRLDIYRMGFYGGAGARKVATVLPTVLTNQPTCITATATGLVDCGNWTQNASWNVPATAVSGIYFARLVRTDGTAGASHVFFVVRDDDGGSDLLFQTSDTTWQAYNTYGGNSLYSGAPAGRAYKVSYNRPFTTRGNAPEDWVFNAEYPMVRFLESNGYDVSYSSGVDTDRRGAELLEHEAFLSVGHDEYWSGTQRTNVEAARAAGVDLAFFSGNEIFWKTRWENSIDGSGTPHRTLVSYKETHADAKIDPTTNVWTGTWRDPRFSPPADGGRPENALSGQIFTINCCAINMVVGQADGQMRFWRNTRVASLAAGATTTIGTNVVGYEWDEDLDNGHRPPGSFRVSQTAGSGDRITDHGSSYAQGPATHSMTMYKAPGGALVFGAGTIQWAWGLDGNHDRGSAAPDTAAQQATVNLLADMGAQPDTIRPGLTAATASLDTTAPTATITSPTGGATLPVGTPVTVSGTAADTGGRVGGVEVSTDNGTTWRRATGRGSWTYTFTPSAAGALTVRARAVDDSANIGTAATTNVTVGTPPASCPCSIWPGTATPDRTDPDRDPVEVGVKFRASTDGLITGIRYYKPVETSGTHVGTLWTSTGTRLGQVSFTNESASGWQQASFATPIPVTAGTTYVASYFSPTRYVVSSRYFATAATTRGPLTALQDGTAGGNGVYRYTSTPSTFPDQTWQSENYWVDVVFTEGADTVRPTLTARTPAPGATGVALGADVTATFSEPVQQPTITAELRAPGGALVPATTSYDSASRTVTVDPTSALAATTAYTASVTGARDPAGNQMDPVTWSFTTDTPDTTAPTVTGRTPAVGATGVALGVSPTATFSEAVQQATIALELRGPGSTLVPATVTYDAATRTATLDPSGTLASNTTYTVNLSGARDASGNQVQPVSWSFTTTTVTSGCPCTIWPSTATPAGTDGDTSSVELGVKFRASSDGFVTGIRYYRPSQSTGTHVGSLWNRTGTRLGQVTFGAGTASGWQEATFASPIPVTAGTTYVASYYTPSRYVANSAYFATAATTRGPLTALQNGTDGGNGLYRYTSTPSTFPDQSFNSENYWVDVVFEDGPDTTAPTVTARTPAPGATAVSVGANVTTTFSEPVQQSTLGLELRGPGGALVAGATTYDAATRTATLDPTANLTATTTYTATVTGVRDTAGNLVAPVSWTFTTDTPDTTRPTLSARTPAPGAGGVSTATNPTATFSEAVQAGTITFELRTPGGSLVAGTTTYDGASRTATLDPTASLAASTTYTASVSGARDTAGNQMDPVSWTFTTAATTSSCPCTIWPPTTAPATTDPDTSAVELGVKFRTDTPGFVTGIRYYRPSQATGTHVGSLWSATGTRLAQVTFTGGTASGWQEATFGSPVAVSPNTTYVASYFTPSRYVVNSGYFSSAATTRGPLTALQNGTDGGNGLYRYTSTASTFPNLSYGSENYWVDVVFQEDSTDTTPPTVNSRVPTPDATGVPVGVRPQATFSESVTGSTVAMVLRGPGGQVVASTTAYDTGTRAATLTPSADLAWSTSYTVEVSGARDGANNTMAPVAWSFQTSAPPPPGIEDGPGGPIAVVTSAGNASSSYLSEILRAEGLNEFANMRVSTLSATTLAPYAVVVLGDVAITDAQVSALTTWVSAGGNLVAMRPDSRLHGLAGITAQAGTVAEGYLAVDAATEPGAGITTDTMQFHGTANRYSLNGATTVATLYSNATTSTGLPAVTLRTVGTNGGQVATFAFDLARSVIATRQGNLAWAGQDRDGATPNRSNDLFFGGAATDWVNLAKAHIPQADEQQRLLANLVTVTARDRFPVPRFWYFPGTHKAVVVATGDDHGTGGTPGRFSTYAAASPSGCSVARWECPRFTSYVYPSTPMTNTQAAAFDGQGFEVGLHPENGCANFPSYQAVEDTYTNQLGSWRAKYSSLPSPTTSRYHCIVWSDWVSQAKAERASGIRLDTNYYYYPGSWVADRPGFMNGSGMPMRFTDTDGTMIDVFQANTNMTDESGQSYPFTPNTLLDRALGSQGYYGAFTANLHTDAASTFEDTQVLASAQARGVPVIAARQLLTWTDSRNGSSFGGLSWSSGTLSFTVGVGVGATGLTAMLPTTGPGGSTLTAVNRGPTPVAFTTMTVKGQEYAVFPAVGGAHQATYGGSGGANLVSAAKVTTSPTGDATATWTTEDPGTSTVRLGTSPSDLSTRLSTGGRTSDHLAELDGLEPSTRYHYRLESRGPRGAVTVWPAAHLAPASFTTSGVDRRAPRISALAVVPMPDGTARVSWRTDEPATSRVRYGPAGRPRTGVGFDDRLVRRHVVVVTDLAATRAHTVRVGSRDASGNAAQRRGTTFRSQAPGMAMFTAEDFRTGTTDDLLTIGDSGLGSLTLQGQGSGTYTSRVVDSGRKAGWRRLVLDADQPRGTRVVVRVRAGDRTSPDPTWSGWVLATLASRLDLDGRYVQYAVHLSATSRALPEVRAIGLTRGGGGVAAEEH